MPTTKEYAFFFRYANDHDPNGWVQHGGKSMPEGLFKELLEHLLPEELIDSYKPGDHWRENKKGIELEWKVMERRITISDWANHSA